MKRRNHAPDHLSQVVNAGFDGLDARSLGFDFRSDLGEVRLGGSFQTGKARVHLGPELTDLNIDPGTLGVTGDLEITEDGSLTVRTEMEPLGELTISTHGQGELVSGSVKVVSEGPDSPIGGGLRFEARREPEGSIRSLGCTPRRRRNRAVRREAPAAVEPAGVRIGGKCSDMQHRPYLLRWRQHGRRAARESREGHISGELTGRRERATRQLRSRDLATTGRYR